MMYVSDEPLPNHTVHYIVDNLRNKPGKGIRVDLVVYDIKTVEDIADLSEDRRSTRFDFFITAVNCAFVLSGLPLFETKEQNELHTQFKSKALQITNRHKRFKEEVLHHLNFTLQKRIERRP